jgi:tetratricopeptide (TPR) repeat protein
MEALILFFFFGLYILVRLFLGGARTDWEKQTQSHQEGIRLLKSKQQELAAEYFENAIASHPHDALTYIMLGHIELSKKEYEQALWLGSRALRLDNTIWQGHMLMSKALYELKDFPNALLNARNAVWFGRDSAEAYHWYGKLLLESGDADKGLEMLGESYKLGEEHAGLLLRKARMARNHRK